MTTQTLPTAEVAVFPIESQYRQLDADCATCNGNFVDVLTGGPCPDCAGDDQATLRRALVGLQGDVQMHAVQLGRRIAEVEREAEILEEHAETTAMRAKSRRRRAETMKDFLRLAMEAAGRDKVKDAFVTVWLQRNPPSFDIIDESAVRDAFKMATLRMWLSEVPTELLEKVAHVEISKTALKEHLEDTGEIVAGVEYVTDRRHLRVRSQ
jgi:hypothetical protein